MQLKLDDETRRSLKVGVPLAIGVDHPAYAAALGSLDQPVRASFVCDLA